MRPYCSVAHPCCHVDWATRMEPKHVRGQSTWRSGPKLRMTLQIYTSETPHTSLLLSMTDSPCEAQSKR